MNDEQWQYFAHHLLEDSDMVAKYSGKLRVERDGVTSALLVLNNTTGEGILVNSEGSAYARYSAYLPFAKPYLDYEIARIADYCVSEGAENTSEQSTPKRSSPSGALCFPLLGVFDSRIAFRTLGAAS